MTNLEILKLKLDFYKENKEDYLKEELEKLIKSLIGNFTVKSESESITFNTDSIINQLNNILECDILDINEASNLLIDIFKLIYELFSQEPKSGKDKNKLNKEYMK